MVTCFLVLLHQLFFSQTVKADLEQLNKKYLKTNQMAYTANYKLFAGNSNTPIESFFTSFKKNGDEYFSKNGDEEYLVNKNFIVFVDHESKEILIQKNTDKKIPGLDKAMRDSPNMGAYIDTLMSVYKSIETLTSTLPNSRAYRFHMNKGPYSKVDMIIDTKQWVLKELTLYFSEKEEINGKDESVKIKISFENYSPSQILSGDFSETKYVSGSKENFKVKPGYSKYTLYDQTSL
jgi:hypothetical protein